MLACVLVTRSAWAYVPNSGDVDLDRKLTIRDAVMILESLGWPERSGLRAFASACDFNHDGACDRADADAIFGVVVRDFNDWDSDGVPNAVDCAPIDDRLATPHTYYRDWDMDHGGDGAAPSTLCVVAPPWPLVEWNGDTNDVNQFSFPVPVPRGVRMLGLDMGDRGEDQKWRGDLAKEVGVDAVTVNLPWNTIETAPNTFAGLSSTLDFYRTTLLAAGLSLNLSVDPMSGGVLTLPSDLQAQVVSGTLRLNDPIVAARFNAVLTHVHTKLAGVPLVSLQIGHEVDRLLVLAPGYFWGDFAALLQNASGRARQLWGVDLKIGTTATQEGLLSDTTGQLLQTLNSLTDIVSFTYMPRSATFTVPEPTVVRLDIERVLARYYPKPLYIQSVGYPSAPLTGSSETKQSQFIRAFFDVWDSWGSMIPFASFKRLSDFSLERAWQEGAPTNGGSAAVAYYQSLGLRTFAGDGDHKAAYKTLRNMAFNRGWWRMPAPTTRTFRLGYTPSLFDFPTEASDYIAMIDWLRNASATDTDIINIHMDHGVPWVEALADTFASNDLPYSQSVKDMWTNVRAEIPAGHKVVVSLNPLGVPRNVIAPYFGVGEGFTYDSNVVRVPNGIVKDSENRYPPGLWNTYALNHPDVKQAYLNYCKRAIDFFQPDYLNVAIEVTATMLQSPLAYGDFIDLQRFVYEGLKADPRYASVPILVSVSATSFVVDEYGLPLKAEEQSPRMRQLQLQGLIDLAPFVDIVGLSFYPHYGKYNSTTLPSFMFDGLFQALKMVGKRVAVTESGFPAETYDVLAIPFLSDPEKQNRFMKLMLTEFERSPVPVEFFVNFQPRDADLGWERLRQGSLQTPPTVSPQFVEFYKYFRDIGLYDGDGNERPTLATWREHLTRRFVPR